MKHKKVHSHKYFYFYFLTNESIISCLSMPLVLLLIFLHSYSIYCKLALTIQNQITNKRIRSPYNLRFKFTYLLCQSKLKFQQLDQILPWNNAAPLESNLQTITTIYLPTLKGDRERKRKAKPCMVIDLMTPTTEVL